MAYRPDIDGLRAIAILAVLLYHVDPALLPAGFLGVDIFFVISGFLIGSQVYLAISDGTFSFRDFYGRRIRRLAPALISVVLVTLVVSIFLYFPFRLERIAEFGVWALVGASNIRFMFGSAYENSTAAENPLLHTWSLGVEEQFYLILPLFLWALFKTGRLGSSRIFIFLLTIASFVFSALVSGLGLTNVNFFSLPARAWELLVGVLAGILVVEKQSIGLGGRLEGWARSVAFLGSIVALASLSSLIDGPSFESVFLVAFVALLLALPHSDLLGRFLGSAPLRYLGKISYPLYLWHFPLLGFAEYRWYIFDTAGRFVVIALAVLLAILTYHFVERPIRFRLPPPSLKRLLGGLFSLVLVVSGWIFGTSGLPSRVAQLPDLKSAPYEYGLESTTGGPQAPIFLVGDSHAEALEDSVQGYALDTNRDFHSWTEGGCPFFGDLSVIDYQFLEAGAECLESSQRERLDWLNDQSPGIVIIASQLQQWMENGYFDNLEGGRDGPIASRSASEEELLREARLGVSQVFSETISGLEAKGHQVVLIYPVPEVGWDVPSELAKRSIWAGFEWPLPKPLSTSFETYLVRTASSFEVLDAAGGESVIRIYPSEILCNTTVASRCVTHSDAEIYYRDQDHLSREGADLVVEELRRQLR